MHLSQTCRLGHEMWPRFLTNRAFLMMSLRYPTTAQEQFQHLVGFSSWGLKPRTA